MSSRSALDAQPLPKLSPQAEQKRQRAKESHSFTLTDGKFVVHWLNAAKGTASYDRAVSILNELKTLPVDFDAFQNTPPHLGGGLPRLRTLNMRHHALNQALSIYAFRPRVTLRVFQGAWRHGMVPDDNQDWFQIKIDDQTVSEADVVMALMRLNLTGDVTKVCRCDNCEDCWLFAAKKNYHFCSAKCREAFYKKAPDYHARKAANQKKYRSGLKRMDVNNLKAAQKRK